MTFNQSTYNVDGDDGPAQPVLVLSNPLSSDITISVYNTVGSATGKDTLWLSAKSKHIKVCYWLQLRLQFFYSSTWQHSIFFCYQFSVCKGDTIARKLLTVANLYERILVRISFYISRICDLLFTNFNVYCFHRVGSYSQYSLIHTLTSTSTH